MKLLLKILKVLFVLFVIVGVIVGAFWMIYIKEWPIWTGASLFFLVIGLVLAWYAIKKLLIRRREKQFVKQVIEQEKSLVHVSDPTSSVHLSSLEKQWAASLSILNGSHLVKQGDPLYVLPWYMMLGASGSGKTSAIRSARLPSPFPEAPQPAGSGTRFCDWWFTEHAIILDTAGKYSTPAIDAADHEEWQRLLTLLLKARRKESLNGLVVTVAADQLLEGDGDTLAEEGRAIRLRVDELMSVLEVKFPVYVLITKCDQIYGVEQLARNLPESFFKQPMGVINDVPARPINEVINHTLDNISERLKDLRFMLLDKVQGDKTGLMLLPEEIRKLQQGLENFMLGLFRSNPYQETPLMRGIFFSSARQSGTPVSRYIQSLEYFDDNAGMENDPHPFPTQDNMTTPAIRHASSDIIFMDVLSGTRRGLFLFDFFDCVLTADRWLKAPLHSTARRFRINWGIGIIAWLAILGGGLGLASTSYMLNRHAMNEYVAEFREPTYLTGTLLKDIMLLDRYRVAIIKMEENNRRWWVPRFGLTQSELAVTRLKKNYCDMFSNSFYDKTISKKLDEYIANIVPDTPGRERGAYVANVVSRLQFVNARLQKRDLEYMKKLPAPSGAFLMLLDSRVTPELARQYQDTYIYYSAWQDDLTPAAINKEKLTMQLGKILIGRSGQYDFNWVLEWINGTETDKRITMRSFWEGSGDIDSIYIKPCFTVAGKKILDDFISRISSVILKTSTMDERIRLFNVDYQHQYIAAWENFARDFQQGKSIFSSNHEMHLQAAAISIDKIPAELFIERMVRELEPYEGEKIIPPWLTLAIEHERIRKQALAADFNKQASGFGKAANGMVESGKNIIKELKSKKIELPDTNRTLSMLDAVNSYVEFRKSLQDMAKGMTTNATTVRLAVDMFSSVGPASATALTPESTALKPSQFSRVQESLKSFQAQMRHLGDDKIYWDIINSTLDFFAIIATREAACSLQEQWESQVLAETSAAVESSLQDLLFGTQGIIWKFVKGPAAPFIKVGPHGYQPISVMEQRVAFNSQFIDFINKGNIGRQKIRDNYTVKIKSYPTYINREATQKPQSVLLTLTCGNDTQSLNNMNYPVNKSFKWNLKNCNNTVLNIKFGSLTLERKYGGERSFINFLSDFRNGEHNFTTADFPEHENELRDMQVQQIKVRYFFEGQNDLLNLTEYALQGTPPPIMATCLQRGSNEDK